jgi:dihydroorotate dehydrogenase
MLYSIFKQIAFQLDPETVHDLSINLFHSKPTLAKLFNRPSFDKKYALCDGHQTWNFPIGLAAGFDKNAMAIEFLQNLGFGAVEIGTVTPKPQIGNAKPRISRIKKSNALLNSMGFPNLGVNKIKDNILHTHQNQLSKLGVNLGKNKDTAIEKTPEDYALLYKELAPLSDYLVINISSPNTPGLRALQSREGFKAICEAVDEQRKKCCKPLYLKIAPELHADDLYDLIDLCKEFNFSGIIATNTSIQHDYGKGGLSGDIIKAEAKKQRENVLAATRETPNLSVIGVGGISEFSELIEFWKAGGSFVQIYTSFIYKGPKILHDFKNEIDHLLDHSDFDTLQAWVSQFK